MESTELTAFERTPDGHIELWLLYRPEPHTPGGIEELIAECW